MKTKLFLWTIVSLVIIGIAVDSYLWLRRPQVLLLPGGMKVTLLGATYGKHHVAPKIKIAGKLTRGNGAQMDSPDDALVVWVEVEHKANEYPNLQMMIYDKAGTACVGTYQNTGSQVNNKINIMGYLFNAYPRWDRSMIVRVQSNGNGGRRFAKEQFVVSNPRRVSVPKWTPEPLPDTRSEGDLAVTLTKLVYGVSGFNGGLGSLKDPMNKAVLAAFHCEQNGAVATNWQPIRIETSDASGNHAQNYSWSSGRDGNGDATMTYQWGLWPDQPWKLRVEMSQVAGFSGDELWSVTNLPVNPGSQNDLWNYNNGARRTPPAFAETTLNGIHLKLYPVIQFTNINYGFYNGNDRNPQKPGGFRVQADQNLDGMQLTLVKADDENGRPVPFYGGSGWGGDSRQVQLQDLRNAKSLNITVALHKSRFVEFTVLPAKQ